jgi:DNA polymerase III alpha subunit
MNLKIALSKMPITTLNETDLVELLYQDKTGQLTVNSSVLEGYVSGCTALGQVPAFQSKTMPETVDEAIKQWNIPDDIQALDLDIYFAEKVNTVEEAVRISEELELFRSRNLETMLRFMIYLVRVMRENNIVWGVGRGSSVSSFLLYLVGLHQINSVKYNLDIKEFIR